ncbi:recombination protein NinG [Martelella alba]|uniref:Recombination protein NinG n=1 Tax=Martelella alba TaxID=2590451 RepID=A0ABY2SGH1_9HYPH|nr:recombination protein NinG [Martelella alba]TKI03559.1 recombination protein NinG [Martelella alba]
MNIPKRRNCKSCGKTFKPTAFYVWWCSDECRDEVIRTAAEKGRQSVARKKAAALKEERKMWRERKAAVKPLKHWEDMTQRVVNDYVRERDRDLPCISCGTWITVQWEAGHYRSRGAASHLRYNELNINKQCHRCNDELSSNAIPYREGLIEKIGLERVLALENDNTPHRYTREELDSIRAHYRAKRRDLLKHREAA